MGTAKRGKRKRHQEYRMELTREEQLGRYIAETGATVRQASAKFGVSKSTVHMGVTI
jgi:transposase